MKLIRNQKKKKLSNNEEWFFIEANDNSCGGYWPGKDEKDACERFGLKMEECSVKSVEWNGKEFVHVNHLEQGKLL